MATPDEADRQPLWKRLGWMALLWLGGVAAVGSVALVLRAWLT